MKHWNHLTASFTTPVLLKTGVLPTNAVLLATAVLLTTVVLVSASANAEAQPKPPPPPPLDPTTLRHDAPDEPPPPPPGTPAVDPANPAAADPANPAATDPANAGAAAALIVDTAAAPEGVTGATAEADALTAENMATQVKPKGFRYTIQRDVLVDEVTDTVLYVRKTKTSKHTKAVPIPMDKKLLGECIAGGSVDDLARGARVTVKYDPKGAVRPEIMIVSKVSIEVFDNATVLTRGGAKLYIVTAEKDKRGFQIEGDASGWDDVVQNGTAEGLLAGAKIRLEYDPSGREPLKITMITPAKVDKKPKGCGCSSYGPRSETTDFAPVLFGLLLFSGLVARRRRDAQRLAAR